jgi:hypothetical protein
LFAAERVAPEEVRCRPVAHKLIQSLLTTAKGQPTQELRYLACRIGLPA